MSFGEAVSSGFSNYVNFSGRAMRSEYWYWYLFALLVGIVSWVADAIVGASGVLYLITVLVVLLPGFAVAVRRLHDIGKSGWNFLWALVPLLGGLYVLYLLVQPTKHGV